MQSAAIKQNNHIYPTRREREKAKLISPSIQELGFWKRQSAGDEISSRALLHTYDKMKRLGQSCVFDSGSVTKYTYKMVLVAKAREREGISDDDEDDQISDEFGGHDNEYDEHHLEKTVVVGSTLFLKQCLEDILKPFLRFKEFSWRHFPFYKCLICFGNATNLRESSA
ncbi:hypothetical protein RIF29_15975 [Crotalaria pallida]|uniref:Uncharacterized protein n=1 Tax=Crotalaria pallida TaxID=3830 RepID=A0AAN9FEH7_CROPI